MTDTRRQTLDAAILIGTTALTRFAFRSHYLYDLDSVNFALALRRFDPTVHQPHPPGYFLYICLGRLVNLVLPDANAALVAMSLLFSCGAVAMIYALANNWFGRQAALFASLIFIFSPLAWFHGIVALTYSVEAFFSALTGYLCWRIYCGSLNFILAASMVVGIAAGFRPSSALLLGPLLLLSLLRTSRKHAAWGIGALLLTLLAWFLPMIRIGGVGAYVSSLTSLWFTVPSRAMVFNSSVANSLARAALIVAIYFLCFGCAAVLPYWGIRGHASTDRRMIIFTCVWIAPGLLFFTFIYLKFVNSGYLLALAPPVCAWMGWWASIACKRLRSSSAVKISIIGACAAVNTAIFLFAPVYCSYSSVRRFEAELETIVAALPQVVSPRDTMIVGFDSHFLGYRHAGYYLPGYLTVQFPEVRLDSGMRVFAMQDRDTRLESRPTSAGLHNFVLFPLPLGEKEYADRLTLTRERFLPGALRSVTRGGHEFSIGNISDLKFLFPNSAPLTAVRK